MFIDFPPDLPPVIMLTQARQNQTDASVPRAIGSCLITENNPGQLVVQLEGISFSPEAAAVNYMVYYANENGTKYRSEEQREALRQSAKNAKITIIQNPKHGRLIGTNTYIPDQGYYGQDKIVALVELTSGEQVTVVYFLHMVHHGIQDSQESIREFCGSKGDMWKISLTPITLDSNAAGYGWFIDYTPYLNEASVARISEA
jgi:hypothetical protein